MQIKDAQSKFNDEVRDMKSKLLQIFKDNKMETFKKVEDLYLLVS